MRSLQVKFSALVVTTLVVACVSLAWMATQHERSSLTAAVEAHGRSLALNLAGDAKEPLLAGDALRLGTLIHQEGEERGLVGARLLDLEGFVAASLDDGERDKRQQRLTGAEPAPLALASHT